MPSAAAKWKGRSDPVTDRGAPRRRTSVAGAAAPDPAADRAPLFLGAGQDRPPGCARPLSGPEGERRKDGDPERLAPSSHASTRRGGAGRVGGLRNDSRPSPGGRWPAWGEGRIHRSCTVSGAAGAMPAGFGSRATSGRWPARAAAMPGRDVSIESFPGSLGAVRSCVASPRRCATSALTWIAGPSRASPAPDRWRCTGDAAGAFRKPFRSRVGSGSPARRSHACCCDAIGVSIAARVDAFESAIVRCADVCGPVAARI